MTPVYVQIKSFLNTIAIGLVMGIVFDFYRALRGMVRPKRWTTGLSDLVIWVFVTCLVFILLLFSNWGEVRVYVFLGFGLGLVIYFKYLSDLIIKFWYSWFAFIVKSFRLAIKIIVFPFFLIKKVLTYPLGLISWLIFKLYELLKALLRKPAKKLSRWFKRLFHRQKPKE